MHVFGQDMTQLMGLLHRELNESLKIALAGMPYVQLDLDSFYTPHTQPKPRIYVVFSWADVMKVREQAIPGAEQIAGEIFQAVQANQAHWRKIEILKSKMQTHLIGESKFFIGVTIISVPRDKMRSDAGESADETVKLLPPKRSQEAEGGVAEPRAITHPEETEEELNDFSVFKSGNVKGLTTSDRRFLRSVRIRGDGRDTDN